MARIRTFKPELWTNSTTGRLDGLTTKLFLGLHNYSDDYGVLRYDPEEYAARILPYEKQRDRITLRSLNRLFTDNLIVLFVVGAKRFIWLPYFAQHQVINRPSKPVLDGWGAETTPASYGAHVLLTEDSLSVSWVPKIPQPPKPHVQAISDDTHGALTEHSRSTQASRAPAEGKGRERSGRERSGVEVATRAVARPRNEQWDGLATVFGYTPTTRSEQSLWGRLAKDLANANATTETITEAATRYQAAMPSVELTPTALVKHYERLMAGRTTKNGKPGTAQHTLALARQAAAREAAHGA